MRALTTYPFVLMSQCVGEDDPKMWFFVIYPSLDTLGMNDHD